MCRKAAISEAAHYNWRKKYGWMMTSEMKRLEQLDEDNQRLKMLVADLSLDKSCRMSSAEKYEPAPKREMVDQVRTV